jgi:hypothetical protein
MVINPTMGNITIRNSRTKERKKKTIDNSNTCFVFMGNKDNGGWEMRGNIRLCVVDIN